MMRYSENESGFIQVVTNEVNKKELEAIGFVDHIDKVKAPVKTRKKAVKTVDKDDK